MGSSMETEPAVTEEQSASLVLFEHLVDESFDGCDYGDKTGGPGAVTVEGPSWSRWDWKVV